jgi:hypothetical protein
MFVSGRQVVLSNAPLLFSSFAARIRPAFTMDQAIADIAWELLGCRELRSTIMYLAAKRSL